MQKTIVIKTKSLLRIGSLLAHPRSLPVAMLILAACVAIAEAKPLKLHAIFRSHMVLQREKPIVIWGWADADDKVSVKSGKDQAEATATGDAGRWEVTFPARQASTQPLTLVVSTSDEKVALEDILIGDVWVASGQSNMVFALGKTTGADFEVPQANLPLLHHFRIKSNEQATPQTDIPAEAVINGGWEISTPQTASGLCAIGYYFGSRVEQALGIPIRVISNARGGASIESLVPAHSLRRVFLLLPARQRRAGLGRRETVRPLRTARKYQPRSHWQTDHRAPADVCRPTVHFAGHGTAPEMVDLVEQA